jgi:hypothetical protein
LIVTTESARDNGASLLLHSGEIENNSKVGCSKSLTELRVLAFPTSSVQGQCADSAVRSIFERLGRGGDLLSELACRHNHHRDWTWQPHKGGSLSFSLKERGALNAHAAEQRGGFGTPSEARSGPCVSSWALMCGTDGSR